MTAQMIVSELEDIVGELYLLPPADFVAARNDLVRQARAAGNRELADALQALRRPTRSAWLVNFLARHEAEALERLSAVGRELRQAQTGLDGPQLKALSEQRRQVVAELLERARDRAAEAGMRLTDSLLAEVEATLHVAVVDLAGSLTVRNGRLTRPLSHTGLGPRPHVDVAPDWQSAEVEVDWIAPPVEDELAARRARVLTVVDVTADLRPNSARQTDDRLPAVRGELRRAEEELARAEAEHWQREYELADAAAAVEAAGDKLSTLDSQRIEARRDKVTAQAHLAEATALQRASVAALADARRRLDLARRIAGEDDPS